VQKTAIVTGAARGIGRGTADHLEAQGWRVARLDVEAGEGIVVCDVSDEASVAHAFEGLADVIASGLGLLVNNAGIAHPYGGPVEDLALADWNRWIGTNLTGAFLMTRAALPALRAAQGAIVNISSTRAIMSEPNSEPYAAAKGGLVALTHALAISHGPDVRANAILPGWIVTDKHGDLRPEDHAQHPAGRAGTPEDVADAVLYLARAGFVTGQTLVIDGGMTKKMIYVD